MHSLIISYFNQALQFTNFNKNKKTYKMQSQKINTPKSRNNSLNPQIVPLHPIKSPYLTQIQTSHSQKQRRSIKQTESEHEQSMNRFLALKKLKQTEQNINMIKGRFKVLKIKQESCRAKTINHQNTLKFNQQAEKYKSQHKAQIITAYKERQMKVGEIKLKNRKLRQQIRQKNRFIKNTIVQQRAQQNKILRQQSIENQKKFKQIKMQDKKQKQQKRNKVYEEQRLQKQRYDKFRQSRLNQTIMGKTQEMNQLLERQNAKQKQLQQLMKIQQDLQKQAMISVQASRVLKSKIQSVIQRRKLKNNGSQLSQSNQLKLPQINKLNDKNYQTPVNKSLNHITN